MDRGRGCGVGWGGGSRRGNLLHDLEVMNLFKDMLELAVMFKSDIRTCCNDIYAMLSYDIL